MLLIAVIGLLLAFALWAARRKIPQRKLSPPVAQNAPDRPSVQVTFNRIERQHPTTPDDFRFERWLKDSPLYDKWFYSKIAGVSHTNADGSSRQEILLRCSPPEPLQLFHEPENPADPNAIALHRINGEVLGYLNADLAREILDRTAKGEVWAAVLKDVNAGHEMAGGNIAMIRFKSDKPKRPKKPKAGE